jgi:hypothetical protein
VSLTLEIFLIAFERVYSGLFSELWSITIESIYEEEERMVPVSIEYCAV